MKLLGYIYTIIPSTNNKVAIINVSHIEGGPVLGCDPPRLDPLSVELVIA